MCELSFVTTPQLFEIKMNQFRYLKNLIFVYYMYKCLLLLEYFSKCYTLFYSVCVD